MGGGGAGEGGAAARRSPPGGGGGGRAGGGGDEGEGGAGRRSTRSPAPCTRARAGSSCEGTSAPSSAAILLRSGIRPTLSLLGSRASRRIAAASALAPPRPAATRVRFSILTRR